MKAWRNGSVSDSRSAGWGFKSPCLHFLSWKIYINQFNAIAKIKRNPIKINIAAGFKELIKDSIFEAGQ